MTLHDMVARCSRYTLRQHARTLHSLASTDAGKQFAKSLFEALDAASDDYAARREVAVWLQIVPKSGARLLHSVLADDFWLEDQFLNGTASLPRWNAR